MEEIISETPFIEILKDPNSELPVDPIISEEEIIESQDSLITNNEIIEIEIENQAEELEEIVVNEEGKIIIPPIPTEFPLIIVDTLLSSSNIIQPDTRYTLDKLASVGSDPSLWSNIPKSLTSFQVELQSEKQIEAVLITKDKLCWTNICLLEESYITFKNFPRFASELGPQLQIVKLGKFYGSISEISFISCCLSLKSLTIMEMDVRQNPRMLLPSEFPKFNKTFGGVKSFTTINIYFDKPKQLEFFRNFLNRFPKLEILHIPRLEGSETIDWEMLKILQSKYLMKPIVDYLNERHNNMNLPVNPIKRCVNCGGAFSTVFSELAQVCAKNGAFLTNVSQKQIQSLFLSQDSTLGKIISLNDGLTDRRLLVRWANLEKVCLKTSVCDIRSETSFQGKVALFPNLKAIHFIFDSDSKTDPEFRALYLLLKLMIGQLRPSVTEFSIVWPPFGHDSPPDAIEAKDIIKYLPNITKFQANNWKAWDDELLVILGGLKKLSHFAIEDCPFFTEYGVLGPDPHKPTILDLTGLKYLQIVCRNGSGSITDLCFSRAFQHMPLCAFVFDVSPNLATSTGYGILTQGIFADHIEIFPQPKILPKDMTSDEFAELRNNFKHFLTKSGS